MWFLVSGCFFKGKKRSFFSYYNDRYFSLGVGSLLKPKALEKGWRREKCRLGGWNWWQSWVGLELNHWTCRERLWPKQRQKQRLTRRKGLGIQLVIFFSEFRGNWEVPRCSVSCGRWKRRGDRFWYEAVWTE